MDIDAQIVTNFVITASTFIGAVVAIIKYLKSGIGKWIAEAIEPLHNKLNTISSDISGTKLDTCKNYIVNFLSSIEKGEQTTDDELRRFYENLQTYRDLGGNGYISRWVDDLVSEGKLDHSHHFKGEPPVESA